MKKIAAVFAALVIIGSGGGCLKSDSDRMVNGTKAEQSAHDQQIKAGNDFECWAEINTEMTDGFEIICRKY